MQMQGGVRAFAFAIAAVGWLATSSHAAAQTPCAEGRVTAEGGYCCWPGQHANETGAVPRPPSCPIGRAAAGVECVALAAAATPSEPAAIREPDGALLGAGIALIVVGYLGAVITDTVAGTSTANIPSPPCIGYCRGPAAPNWGFGFLPLLHPAAGIDAYEPFRTIVFVVSSIGTALEITGLVLAILGQIGRVRTPSSLAAGEARLRWSAPGTQGGMSFELAF